MWIAGVRFSALVLAILVAAGALWPASVGATAPAATEAMPRALAPDEVQAAFRHVGYQVGEPASWSDGASMLAVWSRDAMPTDRPLLRVFVFADARAAAAERRRAHANDEARRNRPITASDDRGPQLLTGYGASAWRRNVALVQASPPGDVGAYPVEPNCDPEPVITATTGLELGSRDFALPTTGVDVRFVELLESLPS
jgi:hypothetical protein